MSVHLPHRHHDTPEPLPERYIEYAVRNDRGELRQWPCGCPRIFGSYERADALGGQGSVVKRIVSATPWTLA